MTKTITLAYRLTHHYKERIFALLIAAIVITAGAYVFLLQKAIVNVVERQRTVVVAKEVSADVSTLEEQFFAAKNKITISLAHSKGLKEAGAVAYISKKSVTAMAPKHEF